jgi:hypothetical protein
MPVQRGKKQRYGKPSGIPIGKTDLVQQGQPTFRVLAMHIETRLGKRIPQAMNQCHTPDLLEPFVVHPQLPERVAVFDKLDETQLPVPFTIRRRTVSRIVRNPPYQREQAQAGWIVNPIAIFHLPFLSGLGFLPRLRGSSTSFVELGNSCLAHPLEWRSFRRRKR